MTFLITLILLPISLNATVHQYVAYCIASETPRRPSKQAGRIATDLSMSTSCILDLGDTALNLQLGYTGDTRLMIAVSDVGFLLCYPACQYSSLSQS
jgi:hypothetical protein